MTEIFVSTFVTLFVIMDPVGTIPVFLSLTAGQSAGKQRRAAVLAVAVSFLVITIFALFGQAILHYLHISLEALQCAGGLLLLLVALELLTDNFDDPVAAAGANVAMVPLGTPLLAGPGAIVATMVFTQDVDSVADGFGLGLGLVVVHLTLLLGMIFSVPILKVLKESGVLLITRIAGLLLSAIAVQMVADAVTTFIANA
ncbi:MarC family protein [Nocardioides sp. NPDC057577]|uniref:MarC family protein n=1 Tax=unclassified Nocardioides TaxID=2615069 RepID=UPI00365F263D